ncbi:uncharacterized protein LOC135072229 [Ostrinia nubilalis]|uniref:uncharacterized protein LOC135072229 n=1 Tax=Ostrinia nubilalis TaxID=29057 RepID=UPI00103E9A87|nr:uncharacterized protein LOC114351263 isoform X1 [Ostrinia furnacalis]XP_028158205.1 uncharacterized protein LOC114351263 isoform X2 [Ostrinia furnacalis]
MDSNSNSSEMCWPKLELDMETEREKRDKITWNSENTIRLIEVLEKDCRELWDVRHPLNRDRISRQSKHEYLACMFGTTAEEISRKIHNLRTQLNNELRKIKRRQSSGCPEGGAGGSGWEYFDALSFLVKEPIAMEDNIEGVNLALAEFQADEEEEFGIAARAAAMESGSPPARPRGRLRVAASAPPPLPPSAHPLMTWPEEAVPRLRPGISSDECQIFGDFVASELRTLRSDESRKKLKRMIQKAILQVGEEEDVNIISG